jgi:hypothetical protein
MNNLQSIAINKTIKYIGNYLKNDQKIYLIEPLTCIIRLAIVSFKPIGTKISIYENSISIHEPGLLQGPIRWLSGDNRNDLHYLHFPITKSLHKWNPNKNKDIKHIYELAIQGLYKLKKSYTNNQLSNLASHSIDLYITLIRDSLNGTNVENVENLQSHNIFDQLWTLDQIKIINDLFNQVVKNKIYSYSYLEAIEKILTTKIKRSKDIILKNLHNVV